jgi:tetratricopeptide (TPR) repeat protein
MPRLALKSSILATVLCTFLAGGISPWQGPFIPFGKSLMAEEPNPEAGNPADIPGADRDPTGANTPAEGPRNPNDFQNYQTHKEKRNESFRNLYQQEADRRFRFILELISEGNAESARRHLENYIVLYPNHPMTDRARRELAQLDRKAGRYRASLRTYEQSSILERPRQGEARALLETARIEIKQGRFERARSLLKDIQDRFSGTGEAREAELLEKSYRFVQPPAETRDSNPDSMENDQNVNNATNNDDPLFPMDSATDGARETDGTGIDRADAGPSTGQSALDRMGEGIESPDEQSALEPLEPLNR